MRAHDAARNRGLVLGAGEFGDIGAGDEARWLRGADHEALGLILLDQAEDKIEFADHRFGERIRARSLAVDHQPADAFVVLGIAPMIEPRRRAGVRPELKLAILHHAANLAFHPHTISISMAPPWPPPMHSVAMPRFNPRRFMAFTRCSTMRLPLVPTGWPSATAPPSTLSRARSMAPAAPGRPSTSRQNLSSCQAARHASTCAANASFNSHNSTSFSVSFCRFKISVAARTGPSPMIEGSSADHWLSTMTAFGFSPCFFTASSEARMTHEAPSVICELLPTVTLPQGRSKAGFCLASFSTELSGRTLSSVSQNV